jgi:hypothetical protein
MRPILSRARLIAAIIIAAIAWGQRAASGDGFDDLVEKVGKPIREWPAPAGPERDGTALTSDRAIARRKQMALRVVATDEFRPNARNPKHMFPVVLARLTVSPTDREALDYISKGMLYRGRDEMFGKSSLSRLFCQFGHRLGPDTLAALQQEVTTYPGFLSGGTENHIAMRRTAGYLFGERFPDAVFHYDLTGEQLAKECREFMRRYGQSVYDNSMVEYLSPVYHAVHTAAWLNVAEFARDDEARLMARAILDWMMADYALNYHHGIIIPPVQRARGLITDSYQLSYARTISQWTGWLYWGGGNTPQNGPTFPDAKYLPLQPYGLGVALHAASSWNPHPVIRNIGAKRLPGAYMLWQSRGNWGCVEPSQMNRYGKTRLAHDAPCDPRYNMRSVYVDRDYAIGASYRHEDIMDPILRTAIPFSVVWRSRHDRNWLFAAHPYWFTARQMDNGKRLGDRDWAGVSPFMQMVHWENAAVVLWDIPATDPYAGQSGKGSPKYKSERTQDCIRCAYIYVPDTVQDQRHTRAGFFFRDGDVYIGIRPVDPEARWESTIHKGYRRIVLPGSLVGFALEVGDQQDFGSFDEFVQRLEKTRLDLSALQSDKRVAYRSSRGHSLELRHRTPGWLPDASVNGVRLDFSRWPTCQSPYVKCRDRVLEVNDGHDGFRIDWTHDVPRYRSYRVGERR